MLEIIIHKQDRIVRGVLNDNSFGGRLVDPANGSTDSILNWSHLGPLNEYQRVAFEVITATFVLTFFNTGSAESDHFNIEKAKLQKVANCPTKDNHQLLGLLYSPGGSGKSQVINMVMEYAKEYCGYMEDFELDKRPIIAAAMTGCAATLLQGETLHSVIHLRPNSRDGKAVTQEDSQISTNPTTHNWQDIICRPTCYGSSEWAIEGFEGQSKWQSMRLCRFEHRLYWRLSTIGSCWSGPTLQNPLCSSPSWTAIWSWRGHTGLQKIQLGAIYYQNGTVTLDEILRAEHCNCDTWL